MRCPLCKTENTDGSNFCNKCGIPLVKLSPAGAGTYSGADEAESCVVPEGIPSVEQPDVPVAPPTGSVADMAREMGLGYDADKTGEIDYGSLFDDAPDEYRPPVWKPDQTAEMPAVSGSQEKSTEFRAPRIETKRKKAPIIIAVVAVLAIAIGAGCALYAMGIIGGPLVPDVVGMDANAAKTVLEEKGLSVDVKLVKSDEGEGTVLLTDPSAKSHIAKNGTVVLQVATPRTVPAVVGVSLEEAQELFKAEGLSEINVEKVKSDEDENLVLAVSPVSGSKVKATSRVTITVSEPYKVPDVTSMSVDEAEAALQAESLIAIYENVYDTSKAEGTIVSVSPEPGTAVKSGSEVVVYVVKDRGKELTSIASSVLSGECTINGQTYEINSVDGLSYAGNDIVQFTVTARAIGYLDGEKVYGSWKSVSGTMQFDSANNYAIF